MVWQWVHCLHFPYFLNFPKWLFVAVVSISFANVFIDSFSCKLCRNKDCRQLSHTMSFSYILSTYDVSLMLNPTSVCRPIIMSTDARTGCQVDVGYWLYDVVTKIQLISDVRLTSGACWDD